MADPEATDEYIMLRWVVDIHAMVNNLEEYVPKLIALRPHLIIVHAEATGDVVQALRQIKQAGIMAGLALLRSTVPRTVEAMIKEAEHILIFSGELGKFGGSASLMQLEKIRLINAIRFMFLKKLKKHYEKPVNIGKEKL